MGTDIVPGLLLNIIITFNMERVKMDVADSLFNTVATSFEPPCNCVLNISFGIPILSCSSVMSGYDSSNGLTHL